MVIKLVNTGIAGYAILIHFQLSQLSPALAVLPAVFCIVIAHWTISHLNSREQERRLQLQKRQVALMESLEKQKDIQQERSSQKLMRPSASDFTDVDNIYTSSDNHPQKRVKHISRKQSVIEAVKLLQVIQESSLAWSAESSWRSEESSFVSSNVSKYPSNQESDKDDNYDHNTLIAYQDNEKMNDYYPSSMSTESSHQQYQHSSSASNLLSSESEISWLSLDGLCSQSTIDDNTNDDNDDADSIDAKSSIDDTSSKVDYSD